MYRRVTRWFVLIANNRKVMWAIYNSAYIHYIYVHIVSLTFFERCQANHPHTTPHTLSISCIRCIYGKIVCHRNNATPPTLTGMMVSWPKRTCIFMWECFSVGVGVMWRLVALLFRGLLIFRRGCSLKPCHQLHLSVNIYCDLGHIWVWICTIQWNFASQYWLDWVLF